MIRNKLTKHTDNNYWKRGTIAQYELACLKWQAEMARSNSRDSVIDWESTQRGDFRLGPRSESKDGLIRRLLED